MENLILLASLIISNDNKINTFGGILKQIFHRVKLGINMVSGISFLRYNVTTIYKAFVWAFICENIGNSKLNLTPLSLDMQLAGLTLT